MTHRILFAGGGTGGHLYPALNLADALRSELPRTQIHFVGARRGVEARVLPERGESCTLLPFEPLRRRKLWRNWRLLPAILRAIAGLRRLFRRFAPRLVVGTGGYASGPACAWALLRGVPVALQEQNAFPGVTTRGLSRWARQIHLGFPEAKAYLRPGPETEVYTLGNPIRPPDPSVDRAACRRAFGLPAEGIVVLVVGGSQGARPINEAIAGMIARIAAGDLDRPTNGLRLLWATGRDHEATMRERLAPYGPPDWVHIHGYIDAMPDALAAADVAVSRAGAMGTAELLAWGVPSVLVPLPSAAANHQAENAAALQEAGAAVHLPQAEATPDRLWRELAALAGDSERRRRMAGAAWSRAKPEAARRIARHLITVLEA